MAVKGQQSILFDLKNNNFTKSDIQLINFRNQRAAVKEFT